LTCSGEIITTNGQVPQFHTSTDYVRTAKAVDGLPDDFVTIDLSNYFVFESRCFAKMDA